MDFYDEHFALDSETTYFNPEVLAALAQRPLARPFSVSHIAEDHPDLPLTSTEEDGVSIWDTLCMFVEHGDRLFMQVSEPFGTEWVRISCCYDHYDSYSGQCTPRHPPTEDELRHLRPECQHLWEVARDEGLVRPGAL